jgi:hypothetical protein
MNQRLAMLILSLTAFAAVGRSLPGAVSVRAASAVSQQPSPGNAAAALPPRAVLDRYCVTCHNQRLKTAGLALDALDLTHVAEHAEVWEKVVRKLRTGAMPPAGRPRPEKAVYDATSAWLEEELDRAAAAHPRPGRPTLHRLNRAEYRNAVRDVLGLDIAAESLLPPDNAGYGFDNIGDVLSLSPALTERYLGAAAKISQMAIGRARGSPAPETYFVPTDLDQQARVSEDLPFGSRGGTAIRYYFPADGEYLLKIRLHETAAGLRGMLAEPSQLDVRIDGVKVQTFPVGGRRPRQQQNAPKPEQEKDASKPPQEQLTPAAAGAAARRAAGEFEVRVPVKAGSRLVQVYFVQRTSALLEDLIEPELRSTSLPNDTSGEPAVSSVIITGPYDAIGAGDSPSRRRIFVCRPQGAEDVACAKRIISNLARRAYRRPVTDAGLQDLFDLYLDGARRGGFESGIEVALRAILVSPEFLFRFESEPPNIAPKAAYRITDLELASRLSFFLWSSVPDDELLEIAAQGRLRSPAVLEQQVRRMLADRRSQALVSNFAGQWLHVRNVAGLQPSPELFFEFDDNLRQAFQRQTELFFESILRGDRTVLDLLDADYTFVNERLARHYGIPGVYGEQFRRINLPPDSVRRGLLGQGSILTVTSYANRTSPVLRGKWILENILGTPPPPPPPDIPELIERSSDGKVLPMRERMAQHRDNPVCASCHGQMDPLGLALENFDAIGRWRVVDESDTPIDASGTLPDRTGFQGPAELRKVLMGRADDFVVTLTDKLLTYALGRGLEYYDAPAVRHIKRESARTNYRFASLIMAIVESTPFQMRQARDRENDAAVAASR